MSKLISAPNLKKQPLNATDCKIYIGVQAWDFAKLSHTESSTEQIAQSQLLGSAKPYPPIVLAEKELSNLTAYRIAPKTAMYISLYRYNQGEPLDDGHILLICSYLAKHTKAVTVGLYDEAGQLLENLTEYVHRLRTNADTQEIAEIVTEKAIEQAKDGETGKHKPYIEKRTENGLRGLYRIIPKYDKETGEQLSERTEWLSDVVEVVGVGRNEGKYFLILQFQPENQSQKVLDTLPLEDVGEREGWKQLKDKGLRVCSKTYLRNELADYLQSSGNREPWAVTNSAGWHNGAYILPNGEIIGTPNTPTIFRSQSERATGYDTKGTLESWQANIAKYADKNPFMMLGVAVALSAPLISLLDAENFGVHLYGDSTAGKTTTANIALSVWGNPKEIALTWDGTAKGITAKAVERCDCLVALDEIGQTAKVKDVESVSYSLFNGTGRMRADIHGNARAVARWQTVALSTGEKDIETFLASGGVKVKAGQLVRLLNIPIARAKHYHDFTDGKAHADHLNLASKQHYGVVGREWITWLLQPESQQLARAVYDEQKSKWLERFANASPQVQRVVGRFAVLETALQLAKHLTLWNVQTNSEALLHCFNEWINEFGLHSREEKQVIEQVNGWLLANAEGRFIRFPIDEKQRQTVHNIAGYRMTLTDSNDKEHFYLYPMAFTEAIKDYPKKQASQVLADKGMLKRGKEQGYEFMVKLPHKVDPKRSRCYLLYPLIEPEADTEQDEANH